MVTQILAVGAWWLCLELIGWVAWPLTAAFLQRTASRGAAFAKHLGLLLVGYLFWLLVSLKLVENTRIAFLLVVVLVAGRPMIVTNELAQMDALVAAWLPGTELLGFTAQRFDTTMSA